jgi:D-sedoheptulose 7-phosphate isomerase
MLQIKQRIESSIDVKKHILQDEKLLENIERSIEIITNCFKNGHRVFFCGNGGSAADAQHLAAEFSGRFYIDRPGLPADAMHCNTSFLTAVGNDYGFDVAYARLLAAAATSGDVVAGLSTSGNSENIVKTFEKAREIGVYTIGFTGLAGGRMKDLSDILLNIPSNDTPRIQECHIMVGHIVCEFVERNIFC